MKKVTIKDVAREAGVSISTVSNALNDVDVLTAKTKKHILEVAERLNYVPNLSGKLLKSGKSNMIGFITSSVVGPYFYQLVEAMSRECELNNYSLNVVVTQDKNVVLNTVLGELVDGIIVFEKVRVSDKEVEQMQKNQVKSVFLDRKIHSESMTSVVFNSFQIGYEATKYLISLGHRDIVFISGHDTMYDGFERKEGYLEALRESGIEVSSDNILSGFFEEEATYNTILSYLASRQTLPTAFLAANDLSAIGCIKALQSRGINVPNEVSVMGFDDIDIAQYFSPPLTTVRNPIYEQGRMAVQQLLKMINGEAASSETILDGELVLRKSCYLKK